MSKVTRIVAPTTELEFNEFLKEASRERKLVVVDYFTTWCEPCQKFAPEFEKLSLTYDDAYFAKVDCDILREVAIKEEISRIPTLKGYINMQTAFTLTGIDLSVITKQIEDNLIQPRLKALFCDLPNSQCCSYLLKIAENIVNNPSNEKFRQLKYTNEAVKQNLLEINSAKECLLSLGFVEEENRLFMPEPGSLENLTMFQRQLSMLLMPADNTSATNTSNNASTKLNQIIDKESLEFIKRINSSRDSIRLYENPELWDIVNAIVDADTFVSKNESPESVLKRLLRWFKNEFFVWFNPPNCSHCSKPYSLKGFKPPTPEEFKGLAHNVEVYQCQTCFTEEFRFPRYNNPEVLLTTRTGRCGEWANCFSLILRTFIYNKIFEKARFVMDWSDHVWCELYLKLDGESKPRWVHVDPCECVYDAPLLYQSGWGKKVTYVIGITLFSGDVQDITWRYTNDYKMTLSDRQLVNEKFLVSKLIEYHKMSNTSAKEVIEELVSFLPTKQRKTDLSDKEMVGRTTGSLEWRTQRGEIGHQPVWNKKFTGENIQPTHFELINNCIHIQYNCSIDTYNRPCDVPAKSFVTSDDCESRSCSSTNSSSINYRKVPTTNKSNTVSKLSHDSDGWKSLASSWQNIKRKVEYDWKIVYLARTDGCPSSSSGEVSWTVDLSGTNKVIDEISVFASSAEFHNSSVKWKLHSGKNEVPFNGFVTTMDFSNQTSVTLTAILQSDANSTDKDCWQHAQLCRQKSTDFEVKTLQIKVELRDIDTDL